MLAPAPIKIPISDTVWLSRPAGCRRWQVFNARFAGAGSPYRVEVSVFPSRRAALQSAVKIAWPKEAELNAAE